jgi:hypothetical protein
MIQNFKGFGKKKRFQSKGFSFIYSKEMQFAFEEQKLKTRINADNNQNPNINNMQIEPTPVALVRADLPVIINSPLEGVPGPSQGLADTSQGVGDVNQNILELAQGIPGSSQSAGIGSQGVSGVAQDIAYPIQGSPGIDLQVHPISLDSTSQRGFFSFFPHLHYGLANHKVSLGVKFLRESGFTSHFHGKLFLNISPSLNNVSVNIPSGLGIGLESKLDVRGVTFASELTKHRRDGNWVESWGAGVSLPSSLGSLSNGNNCELGLGINGTGPAFKLSGINAIYLKGELNGECSNLTGSMGVSSKFKLYQKEELEYIPFQDTKAKPFEYIKLNESLKGTIDEKLSIMLAMQNKEQNAKIDAGFLNLDQNQKKAFDSLGRQLQKSDTNSTTKLDILSKVQSVHDSNVTSKLSELKENQHSQGVQAKDCCTEQLHSLENLNILSKKGFFDNGEGVTGLLTIAFGQFTLMGVWTFVTQNLLMFIGAYIFGGFCGFLYFQILVLSRSPQVTKSPLLNCFFIVLRILFGSLSIYTFGIIIVNIGYNFLLGIPLFHKFSFLTKSSVFFNSSISVIGTKWAYFINSSVLAQKFINQLSSVGTGLCVFNLTVQLGYLPSKTMAISISTAAFALWRYRSLNNPFQFAAECLSYALFASKYNIIIRWIMNTDHQTILNYTSKEKLGLIVTKLIYPLPDMLPCVPIPVFSKTHGFKILLIAPWHLLFYKSRLKAIRKALSN